MVGLMSTAQSFGVPPGKMLIILVLATGFDLMSPVSGAGFELAGTPVRLYASNGASLGPLPTGEADGLLATAGFGFGALAAGVLAAGAPAGLLATAGLGFGCAFGLLPAGALEGFALTAGSGICVMLTSSIMVDGQEIQPRGSWGYEK